MELDQLIKWGGLAGLGLSIINYVWIMAGRGAKPFSDRLDKHSTDLKDHDRRIQELESQVRHVPSAEQVHDLRVTVERLDTHLKSLDRSIDAFGRTVQRIDDYLRENK